MGKYHCTVDLLFDWFGLVCFANKNSNCQLSYSWFQTSQTGGQQYSYTSHFSIPCSTYKTMYSIPWSLPDQGCVRPGWWAGSSTTRRSFPPAEPVSGPHSGSPCRSPRLQRRTRWGRPPSEPGTVIEAENSELRRLKFSISRRLQCFNFAAEIHHNIIYSPYL